MDQLAQGVPVVLVLHILQVIKQQNAPPAVDRREREALVTGGQVQNILPALLPARLAEVFPALCGVSAIKQPAQITAAERARIVSALQSLPLTVTGTRGMDEAIVTCGGVSVREIVPATMMSKKVNGLFFAGEMMDVDAFTGGFNLQIAFSTGALAGHSAAVYERE